MDYYLDDGRIKYRAYFPLLFKSMIANFPDIMKYVNGTAIKEEDFYTDEYLKIKPEIDKMFAEKKYTLDVIDEKIRELLGIDKDDEFYGEDIDKILNSKMFNKYSSIRKALYKCFDKWNLTTGWTPKHKIETFCVSSGLFSYRESEALKNAFQDKVTYQYLFSKTAYSIFYKTVFNADW